MWDDPNKFLTLWTEAMRAKYFGEGGRWGKREFDVVLGEFDVRIWVLFSFCLSAAPECVLSRYHIYYVLLLRVPELRKSFFHVDFVNRPSWTSQPPAWSKNS